MEKNRWNQEQILLNEVIDGVTPVRDFYLKHASLADQARFESIRKKHYDEGAIKGLKPHDVVLEACHKDGSWTKGDESTWHNQARYIETLRDNSERVVGPQKEYFEENLMKELGNFHKMSKRRDSIFSNTLESRCDKWAFEEYVPSLIFKDSQCTQLVYDPEDLAYMDDSEYDSIYSIFGEFREMMGETGIKTLACSSLCQNMFFAAQTCQDFFGVPIIKMTEIQMRLFLHMKNYNGIISNLAGKVKDSVLTDWKALEGWNKGTEKQRERLEGEWSNHKDSGLTMEDIRRNAQKKHTTHQEKMKGLQKIVK